MVLVLATLQVSIKEGTSEDLLSLPRPGGQFETRKSSKALSMTSEANLAAMLEQLGIGELEAFTIEDEAVTSVDKAVTTAGEAVTAAGRARSLFD